MGFLVNNSTIESIQNHSPGLYTPYRKLPKFTAMYDAGWQHGR